jgi:hypothetical protein
VCVAILRGNRLAPNCVEIAKGDGLSRIRFCWSNRIAICLSSESRDKQQANSSAKESRVLRWTASFSCI